MPESWIDGLVLSRVAGVGDRLFRSLVDAFGSAGAVLASSPERLREVGGVGPAVAAAIAAARDRRAAEQEARRVRDAGFFLVPYGDPTYPTPLSRIHDPPAVLYGAGALRPRDAVAVAIVGSRRATTQGARFARWLARDLAAEGVTVVSGLAEGIDAAAHAGALEGGGRTFAVFGSGLDVLYPARNAALAGAVRESGAWLSELPLGSEPLGHHFPRRNRIISGLTLGVVVVEAAEKSGSLITALAALDQNREVFAVPGPPGSFNSRGAHRLLRMGAKLVETAADVLEELSLGRRGAVPPPAAPEAEVEPLPLPLRAVWAALEESPLHIDEVSRRAGVTAAEASVALMELCLRGAVDEMPGKLYARCSAAFGKVEDR
ncbi:MAG: DNA-protecting protein DprA [Deltaproteobacteria bacterium]|nr:DNA-protecting protein DprA [Deltaproteobacteria bacterium]